MIEILLVIIALLLALIARGLWVINENIRYGARTATKDATDVILLLRGIKAILVEEWR